jgi:hypothetical protein
MVVMAMVTVVAVAVGMTDAVWPEAGMRFAAAIGAYYKAVPSEMWGFAGVIFLGYAGARSFDKHVEAKTAATGDTGNAQDEGQ